MDAFLRVLWRALCVGCCAGLPLIASALSCPYVNYTGTGVNASADTVAQVCPLIATQTQAWMQAGHNPYPNSGLNYSTQVVSYTSASCVIRWTATNPANGQYVDGGEGTYTPTVVPCPPNECTAKAGTNVDQYFNIGWSIAPPNPNYVTPAAPLAPPTGTQCVQGCRATYSGSVPGTVRVSLVSAANGMFRVSAAYRMLIQDQQCSAEPTAPNNPGAPPLPCPGFTGLIDGKTRCVPPAQPASAPYPWSPTGPRTGNPASGSDPAASPLDPAVQPPDGSGGNNGGPPQAGDGGPIPRPGATPGGSGGGGGTSTTPGTGAPGGGSPTTGTDGKNDDGGVCERNPSASGCGGTAAGQPDLYAKKSKTVSDVLGSFKNTVSSAGLGQGITNFFTLNLNAGSCPTWNLTIDYFSVSVPIDFFCSSAMQYMLLAMRSVLLIVAGWAAFRIAVY